MTTEEILKHYGPLDSQSTVVDLGGFAGNFSLDVLNNFSPKSVHVFEPVPEYMEKCRSTLSRWPNVTYHQVAVGEIEGETLIALHKDATSLYSTASGSTTVKVVSPKMLLELLPDQIDLTNMNCEGGEYCLLEYLIEVGCVSKFKHLWIQFHDTVPNFAERFRGITSKLEITHHLRYNGGHRWQEWCSRWESNPR